VTGGGVSWPVVELRLNIVLSQGGQEITPREKGFTALIGWVVD